MVQSNSHSSFRFSYSIEQRKKKRRNTKGIQPILYLPSNNLLFHKTPGLLREVVLEPNEFHQTQFKSKILSFFNGLCLESKVWIDTGDEIINPIIRCHQLVILSRNFIIAGHETVVQECAHKRNLFQRIMVWFYLHTNKKPNNTGWHYQQLMANREKKKKKITNYLAND